MIRPNIITFTGLDERCHPDAMRSIVANHHVEWGILFGGRLGKNRYPRVEFVGEFMSEIGDDLMWNFAAHLCGAAIASQIKNRILPDIPFDFFDRIQWNAINYDYEDVTWLHETTGLPIILQHRNGDWPRNSPEGVFFLHDQSGGKGKVPTSRPPQGDRGYVGYAGGFRPENVLEIVSTLDAHHFWIDMETGVRTSDDWLDLDKCEAVCDALA